MIMEMFFIVLLSISIFLSGVESPIEEYLHPIVYMRKEKPEASQEIQPRTCLNRSGKHSAGHRDVNSGGTCSWLYARVRCSV